MWWMPIVGSSSCNSSIFLGAIIYAHFGTPCNTFSSARKEDGGPPPLRDVHHPDGIPSLTGDLWSTTFLGNLVRDRTCEACFVLILLGADFSIENPLSSLIWETPLMIPLLCRARAFMCDFDLCLRSSQQEANTCDGHSPASAEGSVQTLPRTELYTSTRSVERESL